MVEVNLAILTSLVAAVTGLLSGWVAAYLKVKGENLATKEDFANALERLEENTKAVERIRSEITRRASIDTELRTSVKQATTAIGALVHSICWLTWDCIQRKRLDREMVKRYDDEAHRLMPEIIGQLAVIAMLQSAIHTRLSPLADDVIELDARVGDGVISGEQDLQTGLRELHRCHERGMELERRVRAVVADLFAVTGR
jgi:tetrahydromethanopterin S-methyltransferase subunit G